MAMQAQDTFVAELKAGPLYVQKGQVFPDGHEVVKLDAGRGLLFHPLDLGDDEKPPPKSAAKAEKDTPVTRPGKAS
jgi:hypothetical protein